MIFRILQLYLILSLTVVKIGVTQISPIQYSTDLSNDEEYKVVLMGGQSNMTGAGKIDDIGEVNFENVFFFDFGLTSNLEKTKNNFGPEIGIANELNSNYPTQKFILIKYSVGGSSLLDWTPFYNNEQAKITGHPEFGNLYANFLAKVAKIRDGLSFQVVALIWMQGERDAKVPKAAVSYYDNFKSLINSLRDDLNQPNLPIIYGEINPPSEEYPASDIVIKAQRRANKKLQNTYMISTDGIEKWDDNVHYSSKGQLHLGQKFGKKLIEILNN